jgi:hypothetical protein
MELSNEGEEKTEKARRFQLDALNKLDQIKHIRGVANCQNDISVLAKD